MSNIGLIIEREFNQRVRKRSFIITTIITPILFAALMTIPTVLAVNKIGAEKAKIVNVKDNSGIVADKLTSGESVIFQTITGEIDIQSSDPSVFGTLEIGKNIITDNTDVRFYSQKTIPINLERDIENMITYAIKDEKLKNYNIENLNNIINDVNRQVDIVTLRKDEQGVEKNNSAIIPMALAYILGFMIYMFIFMYGQGVMTGVIDEKNNRIVEVMVSSVKPFDMMMGKILGIASVAFLQFIIWIVFTYVLTTVLQIAFLGEAGLSSIASAGGGIPPGLSNVISSLSDFGYIISVLAMFGLYFVGGYLLYASMFAAVGSAVDNVQEAQQFMTPITIPLILSLIVMMSILQAPDSQLAFWMSMIPFTSPVVMMARIPFGVPAWEIALSLVLLYSCFVGMTYVASKIYRVGIFMYGKKTSWKEIIKWIKYN